MSLLRKLLKCKEKVDKIALREPRTARQVKARITWERLRKIMLIRYDR